MNTFHILIVNTEDHYRDHREYDWSTVIYAEDEGAYLSFMSLDRNADIHAHVCQRVFEGDGWFDIQQRLAVRRIVIHPLCHEPQRRKK